MYIHFWNQSPLESARFSLNSSVMKLTFKQKTLPNQLMPYGIVNEHTHNI